jgi:hypothetical protein
VSKIEIERKEGIGSTCFVLTLELSGEEMLINRESAHYEKWHTQYN